MGVTSLLIVRVDTRFSDFLNLQIGVRIFNFGLTESVGEKEVDNMGREGLSDFPDLGFWELWVHNEVQYQFSNQFGELRFTISDTILFSEFLVALGGVNEVAIHNLPN